jgi:hypothetical protein
MSIKISQTNVCLLNYNDQLQGKNSGLTVTNSSSDEDRSRAYLRVVDK